MQLFFSFIVPVYNRPVEVQELLESFTRMEAQGIDHEIIIVEDGSTETSEHIVQKFQDKLPLSYYYKDNTGPGLSRNYGMERAIGNYFIILDSDVLLPSAYLRSVKQELEKHPIDCFGGADRAHQDFSPIQKAINFSMTSFLTTGGIRGKKSTVEKFKPRSFNMGFSREVFIKTGGYAGMAVGEDLDLSLRIAQQGFKTAFIQRAYVFHKRRIRWTAFCKQVYKFGMGRPILDKRYGRFSLFTLFPSCYLLGLILALILVILGKPFFMGVYIIYFLLIFVNSSIHYRNLQIGLYSVWASILQFICYGSGYLKAFYYVRIRHKQPEEVFPNLFFEK